MKKTTNTKIQKQHVNSWLFFALRSFAHQWGRQNRPWLNKSHALLDFSTAVVEYQGFQFHMLFTW